MRYLGLFLAAALITWTAAAHALNNGAPAWAVSLGFCAASGLVVLLIAALERDAGAE